MEQHTKVMSLREKENELREKDTELRRIVALPDIDDWQLLSDDEVFVTAVVSELNAVLVSALECAKSGDLSLDNIAKKVFPQLAKLSASYPSLGITDSEGYDTVARFFAINYDPSTYWFFRFYGAYEGNHEAICKIPARDSLHGALRDATQGELMALCELGAWMAKHQTLLVTGRKHGIRIGVTQEVIQFMYDSLDRESAGTVAGNLMRLPN